MFSVVRVFWASCLYCVMAGAMAGGPPVKIGIDAEFSVGNSTSAQAIAAGVAIAVAEINQAGGVLGRPLAVVEKDNHSVPGRARANLRELAGDPDVVAVFCGKHSPVVVDLLPDIHQLRLPMLDPWAAADPITVNDYRPSYVFRLSLRDSWAMQAMGREALRRGFRRIGLLVPNTEWGRSSQRALAEVARRDGRLKIAETRWYNWGEASLLAHYQALRAAGAEALILVANEQEGALLLREMLALSAAERLPILSHWGVTGGRLATMVGPGLTELDFAVVQTFSFSGAAGPVAERVARAAMAHFGVTSERAIPSPAGVAHAYDLTQLLARAIVLAGSTDRAAVRAALERLGKHEGLIKTYRPPFTPSRHDALAPEDVFLTRYGADGALNGRGR